MGISEANGGWKVFGFFFVFDRFLVATFAETISLSIWGARFYSGVPNLDIPKWQSFRWPLVPRIVPACEELQISYVELLRRGTGTGGKWVRTTSLVSRGLGLVGESFSNYHRLGVLNFLSNRKTHIFFFLLETHRFLFWIRVGHLLLEQILSQ